MTELDVSEGYVTTSTSSTVVFHVTLLWKFLPRDAWLGDDVAIGGDGIGNAVEKHVEGSLAPQQQFSMPG